MYQIIRNERRKFLEIQFWLCIYDFKENSISKQKPIWFPELDLKYEPQGVCISASSEPIKIREAENTTDYYQCY